MHTAHCASVPMTKEESAAAINALGREAISDSSPEGWYAWCALSRLWAQLYGDMTLCISVVTHANARRDALYGGDL